MNQGHSTFAQPGGRAVGASVDARARFIVRTYNHLFLAILAFTAVEVALFATGMIMPIARGVGGHWWLAFGAFILVGWIGRSFARRTDNVALQYLGLAAIVGTWSLIFAPLLVFAEAFAPGAIQSAALVTILSFAGLTAIAFVTRKDFSFLRGILMWGGVCALVLIVAAALFGFKLGTFFMVAMVALAGGSILYDTSNVIHHYREDQHVAAAIELFADVALLFWYLLSIFSSRD